jgi:hypothetical protein
MALTQLKTGAIADDAVTTAKLAAGTDGHVITYDASGNPTTVGPGTDGQVLTSTGAGSPPAFEDASGTTINNNADNRVITGSGTANTLEAESNVVIDSSGNVGIGTTSPSGKLNLATGASAACELRLTSNNTGSGSGDRGRLSVYSSRNDGTAFEAGKIEIDRESGTEDKARIQFFTNGGSGNTERVRIDSSGNVGIARTSPDARLHIDTSHYVVSNSGISTTGIHLDGAHGNTGEYGGGISFACGGAGSAGIAARQASTSQHRVGLSFFTHDTTTSTDNAVEKVRLHDSGEVSFNNGICLGNSLTLAASNTMDDYEEGTFTPVWLWSPNDVSDESYATQSGQYVKIGKTVFFRIELTLSNKGTVSGAGYAQVAGLPFQCGGPSSVSIGYFDNFGSFMPAIAAVSTSEQIYIAQLNSGGYSQDLQHSHMNNSTRIYVGGTYLSN